MWERDGEGERCEKREGMRGRCEGCVEEGEVAGMEFWWDEKVPVCTVEHIVTLMQSSRLVTCIMTAVNSSDKMAAVNSSDKMAAVNSSDKMTAVTKWQQ